MTQKEIKQKLQTLDFPSSEYWVITGSAMVLYGIREQTHDIDLGCTKQLADRLEAEGCPVERLADGNRKILMGEDVEIFENWLYDRVESVDGFPVISLKGLITMKKALGREKDLRDLALIQSFQNRAPEPDFSEFLIETKSLILRKAADTDLEIYQTLWRHWESARYMLWQVTENLEDAKERLRKSIEFQRQHKYAFFVQEKCSGKVIGFAGMKEIEPGVYEDTGIGLGPDFTGKGYGTEILTAFIEEARAMGARRFVASCRKQNLPSHKLMMKCGFSFSRDEARTDPRDGSSYVLEINELAL